jgi:hypothetical protein
VFNPAKVRSLSMLAALLCAANLLAQSPPSQNPPDRNTSAELREVLERLAGLERANLELAAEVRALRERLPAAPPQAENSLPASAASATSLPAVLPAVIPIDEQLAVQTQQIEELAQTKVESSQRFPIRLKGMILFNTFLNSKQGGLPQYPTVASERGDASGGAGLRQSIFGFDFDGPRVMGDGKLHASLLMDFFGGSGQPLQESLRLRTATIQVDWKSRGITLGIDKPIFAPRNPTSLAQVAVSPLTGAGNLWMWIPQAKFEQRFQLSDQTRITGQIGIVQTREIPSYQASDYIAEVAPARPGLEGRVEFSHNFGSGSRIEIAPGFHVSTSHVAHAPVPSKLVSADWLISPWRGLELTGAFYAGENVSHLGTGGVGQGFAVAGAQQVKPLRSKGGWTQLTIPATSRLSFHLFSGIQNDFNPELPTGEIGRNLAYGANFFYHLSPNLILSLESSQVRTTYINIGQLLNNHHDLAIAYLF